MPLHLPPSYGCSATFDHRASMVPTPAWNPPAAALNSMGKIGRLWVRARGQAALATARPPRGSPTSACHPLRLGVLHRRQPAALSGPSKQDEQDKAMLLEGLNSSVTQFLKVGPTTSRALRSSSHFLPAAAATTACYHQSYRLQQNRCWDEPPPVRAAAGLPAGNQPLERRGGFCSSSLV